jgi:hypothetical protein
MCNKLEVVFNAKIFRRNRNNGILLSCCSYVRVLCRYKVPWIQMVVSGAFIGSLVMIIPYVLLGIFSNIIFEKDNPIKNAFLIGFTAVVAERLAIYLIGFTFILRDIGPYEPTWSIGLPYFTPLYIYFGGFISLVLCTLTAWIRSNMLKRKKV